MTARVPRRVVDAYDWGAGDVEVAPISGGLINDTYVVRVAGEPRAVVQRLHPIFGAEVNLDLDAVTTYLARAGLDTPRLITTRDGSPWIALVDSAGGPSRVWRALTHVAGTTVHRLTDAEVARSAGELVGRFHRVLDGFDHTYAFTRAGVHDTARHLARLRAAIEGTTERGDDRDDRDEGRRFGRDILAAAAGLPPRGDLPLRHTHGDLKISNVLFAPDDPRRARCLLDLDTLGRQTMAYELGDAMRSWCNPDAEDADEPRADPAIFAAAMDGHRAGAGDLLTRAERDAIVPGWETVCVELAARFCVDVFDDSYFAWDPSRFSSRAEHNLARARNQLALARSVRAQRRQLADLV